MTAKHYNILAKAISETKNSGVTCGQTMNKVIERLVDILSKELKTDNVNFNELKFKKAIYGK